VVAAAATGCGYGERRRRRLQFLVSNDVTAQGREKRKCPVSNPPIFIG
jgi:hypothetical protein